MHQKHSFIRNSSQFTKEEDCIGQKLLLQNFIILKGIAFVFKHLFKNRNDFSQSLWVQYK